MKNNKLHKNTICIDDYIETNIFMHDQSDGMFVYVASMLAGVTQNSRDCRFNSAVGALRR